MMMNSLSWEVRSQTGSLCFDVYVELHGAPVRPHPRNPERRYQPEGVYFVFRTLLKSGKPKAADLTIERIIVSGMQVTKGAGSSHIMVTEIVSEGGLKKESWLAKITEAVLRDVRD